jgi:hypothetical protein
MSPSSTPATWTLVCEKLVPPLNVAVVGADTWVEKPLRVAVSVYV